MDNQNEKRPLKEVWLFLVLERATSYGSVDCLRVFAELGEHEIALIAEEIAERYDCFRKAIQSYVNEFIKKELAKGETEIDIDENEDEFGGERYIVVKYEIDSGFDWQGYDCNDGGIEETNDVFVGSTVYFSTGYGLYSSEIHPGAMDELTIE